MLRAVRRIVTGHDANGRSVVISDDTSPHIRENPVHPNRGLTDLWRTFEGLPSNLGAQDAAATEVVLSPPTNGTVFRFFQIPPERDVSNLSWEERQRQADAVFAGMGAAHNRDSKARHPGMHTTETVGRLRVSWDCLVSKTERLRHSSTIEATLPKGELICSAV